MFESYDLSKMHGYDSGMMTRICCCMVSTLIPSSMILHGLDVIKCDTRWLRQMQFISL